MYTAIPAPGFEHGERPLVSGCVAESIQRRRHRFGEAAPAVSGIVEDVEFALGPGAVQIPRRVERTGNIPTPVDENGGNVGQTMHATHHLGVGQKAAVAPVMGDQSREDQAKVAVLEPWIGFPAWHERHVRVLPAAPFKRCAFTHGWIRMGQESSIGRGQIAALRLADKRRKSFPLKRKDAAHVPRDPRDFAARPCRHRAEDHRPHPFRMTLRVDKSQRHPPGNADHYPAVDPQVGAQPFNIINQVISSVDA